MFDLHAKAVLEREVHSPVILRICSANNENSQLHKSRPKPVVRVDQLHIPTLPFCRYSRVAQPAEGSANRLFELRHRSVEGHCAENALE